MKYYKQLFRFIFGFLITILILEFFLQIGEINSLTNVKQDKLLGSLLKSNSKFLYFNEGFL